MTYYQSNRALPSASDFGRVAVICGGHSRERAVSLSSGQEVWEACQRYGIDAKRFDPQADQFVQDLLRFAPQRAFVVLHGTPGEEGSMQGFLEVLGIPYTSSSVAPSALAMDKIRTKWIWQRHGLSTPDFDVAYSFRETVLKSENFGVPLTLKPALEGSSLGVIHVESLSELSSAAREVCEFGPVIIERTVIGKELTVPIVDGQPMPVIEIRTPADAFYDFKAKYHSKETEYLCPAPISKAETQSLCTLAKRATNILGISECARVDFMQDSQGQPWLLEVNTIPGFTPTSLVPKAAKVLGIDFIELVVRVLALTLDRTTAETACSNPQLDTISGA